LLIKDEVKITLIAFS